MITGVIYKYTCPVGKHYIGQTINECYRRGLFFLAKHYGGHKIDKARKEFGPENFTYEILIKNTYADKGSAKVDLDKLEAYYIAFYNSIEQGYNTFRGINLEITSSPRPDRIYANNGVPPVKDIKHMICQRHRAKSIEQYSLEGILIATYDSISEASRKTNIHISNISRNCQGKTKRVRNFIFKYKENYDI